MNVFVFFNKLYDECDLQADKGFFKGIKSRIKVDI